MCKYYSALAVVASILLACVASGQERSREDHPVYPVQLGWVSHASLVSFAPPRLDAAFLLLNSRKGFNAIPAFQAELEQHPEDFAAYIGMAQAQPSWRQVQIQKLEKTLSEHPRDAEIKSKLATVLYYEWAGQSVIHPIPACKDYLSRAVELADDAWNTGHDPLTGLMFAEIAEIAIVTPEIVNKPSSASIQAVLDRIVAMLAGKKAYNLYAKAKRREWVDLPPSVTLTPEADRRALRGMLKCFWTQSSSVDMRGVEKNGKLVFVPYPVSPVRVREAYYMDTWIKSLLN
jgi:hypothetical protein